MTSTSDQRATWAAWLKRRLDLKGWTSGDLIEHGRGVYGRNAPFRWLNASNIPKSDTVRFVAELLDADPREAYAAAGYTHLLDMEGDVAVTADPAEAFIVEIKARRLKPHLEKALIGQVRKDVEDRRQALRVTLDLLESAEADPE